MGKGKKRAGRRRVIDVSRHPCGQTVKKSPAERATEARSVGEEARQRVHGLSRDAAVKPEAGSAVGRAMLQGTFSKAQADAAGEYERVCREFHETILAGRIGSPADMDRVRGHDGGEGNELAYVIRCAKARDAMQASRRVLMDACIEHRDPLVQFAVNTWALDGETAYNLVPSARIGLNALAKLAL